MMMDNDIFLIDKPCGITSFDVIRALQRKWGKAKMGHSGTLDPQASGLLLIAVGKGTKKLQNLIGLDKTYVAEVLLGEKTDTGDAEGVVIEKQDVGEVDERNVREVLSEMETVLSLRVPAYSAIKKKGKPLYKYAREGRLDEVEVPIKEMRIDKIELKEVKDNILTIEMDVGSGTYVRSVAEEIGRRLGVPARLDGLRRTRIGTYRIEDAVKLADIKNYPGISG